MIDGFGRDRNIRPLQAARPSALGESTTTTRYWGGMDAPMRFQANSNCRPVVSIPELVWTFASRGGRKHRGRIGPGFTF